MLAAILPQVLCSPAAPVAGSELHCWHCCCRCSMTYKMMVITYVPGRQHRPLPRIVYCINSIQSQQETPMDQRVLTQMASNFLQRERTPNLQAAAH